MGKSFLKKEIAFAVLIVAALIAAAIATALWAVQKLSNRDLYVGEWETLSMRQEANIVAVEGTSPGAQYATVYVFISEEYTKSGEPECVAVVTAVTNSTGSFSINFTFQPYDPKLGYGVGAVSHGSLDDLWQWHRIFWSEGVD